MEAVLTADSTTLESESSEKFNSIESRILNVIPEVTAVVAHYFKNENDREDAVQEVLTKILDKQSFFRGESPFKHWAVAIASRTCLSRVKRKRVRSFFWKSEILEQEPEKRESVEGEALIREKAELLRRCVQSLKSADREIITLCDLMKKSDLDVAKVLNISEGNLRVKRHRARKKLKDELLKRGYQHDG